jgi:hypothetical protein
VAKEKKGWCVVSTSRLARLNRVYSTLPTGGGGRVYLSYTVDPAWKVPLPYTARERLNTARERLNTARERLNTARERLNTARERLTQRERD